MLAIESIQIAELIHLKKLRADFTAKPIASSSSELFYAISPHKYIHIFNYGVVAFVGHSELEKSHFIKFLKDGYIEDEVASDLTDSFQLVFDESARQPVIANDRVTLNRIDENAIRIITLNVAQSVAFDYYEELTYDILARTKTYLDQLEKFGKVKISKSNLLKFIGRTRIVKNSIVDNLYILDDPLIVWDDVYLEKINKGLKEVFDVYNRFRDLDYKLKIVEENLNLFTDLIQHKESSRLEWIIIILILIEILNLFAEKLF
jgi:uncharacterized Rmd1/YagE family protein